MPTETEWEYAALGLAIRIQLCKEKKYPYSDTSRVTQENAVDQLANFKQGRETLVVLQDGQMMMLKLPRRQYPPNILVCMACNV